ncbi:hypothetical protein ApDm4_1635 [Acetobacter pomorum]|nr:hypothetical protein ApDm4_1635 [Acetobacter pomorum]
MNWRDILFGHVFLFRGGIFPLYLYLEPECLSFLVFAQEGGKG